MNSQLDELIAVIIPAYNEEITIENTVREFNLELPRSRIIVINNNSTDETAYILTRLSKEISNLTVLNEPLQGKGHAIRRAFTEVDADFYIMVDGDETYPAIHSHELLAGIRNTGYEMAIGDRISSGAYKAQNERRFHAVGNLFTAKLVNKLFNSNQKDVLSGYRAFTRKFVENFPITVQGFELETQMTLHALDKKLPIIQIPINYRSRPIGSTSNLNTIKDGYKIVVTAFSLLLNYKPRKFLSYLASIGFVFCLLSGILPIMDFIQDKYVKHVPLALLSVGFGLFSLTLMITGLILQAVADFDRRNFELNLLANQRKQLRKRDS